MKSKIVSLLLSCLMLAACTGAPPATEPIPSLTFEQMQPIPLNVAKVEVINTYIPAMAAPAVDHLFPVPPGAAAEDLVRKKLLAEGDRNILRVIIANAAVTSQALPVAQDFWGTFRLDPQEKLNGEVDIRFEMVEEQAPDIVIGHASVIGKRTGTIMEGASPAERDRAMLGMTEALMNDVYDGFRTVVKNTFGMP